MSGKSQSAFHTDRSSLKSQEEKTSTFYLTRNHEEEEESSIGFESLDVSAAEPVKQKKVNRKKKSWKKKNLMERRPKTKIHPILRTGLYGQMVFNWVKELHWVTRRNCWEQDMNYDLPEYDKVTSHKPKMVKAFKKTHCIFRSMIRAYFFQFIMLITAATGVQIVSFSTAYFTQKVVKLTDQKHITDDIKQRIAVCYLYMAVYNLSHEIGGHYFAFLAQRISLAIRSSILSMIQDKIMKFSTLNSRKFTEGNLTNLIQVDSTKITDFFYELFEFSRCSSAAIVGIVYLAILTDGYVALLGLFIFFILNIPYTFVMNYKLKVQKNYLYEKDKRMNLFRNVLENIEFVKIKGLENYFCLELFERREKEIIQLKYNALISGLVDLFKMFPYLASLICCCVMFLWLDIRIDYSAFITFISLFKTVKYKISDALFLINYFTQLSVSVKRINLFLNAKEHDMSHLENLFDPDSDVAISVENGHFKWKYDIGEEEDIDLKDIQKKADAESQGLTTEEIQDARYETLMSEIDMSTYTSLVEKENNFELHNINLQIKKGDKVVVMGPSNSGKSSLLYALLSEMIPLQETKIVHGGSVGYLDQGRWLVRGTIKDNIVMGKKFNQVWFDAALMASQLILDIDDMANGVDTCVNNNSDTVSGGQRARIALARIFYQK